MLGDELSDQWLSDHEWHARWTLADVRDQSESIQGRSLLQSLQKLAPALLVSCTEVRVQRVLIRRLQDEIKERDEELLRQDALMAEQEAELERLGVEIEEEARAVLEHDEELRQARRRRKSKGRERTAESSDSERKDD